MSNQDFVGKQPPETLGDTPRPHHNKSISLSADASKDLPSVDANPMSQLHAQTVSSSSFRCRERIAHLDSGADRRRHRRQPRRAKHGHDVVTGEPLDDATMH